MVDTSQQIKLLNEELHNIKIELNAWKEHAKDSDEKLEFLDKQNGTANPASAFYDPAHERIIEKLGKDNLTLRKQITELTGLESRDCDTILKEREALKDENARLKDQLEIKFRENQRLKRETNDNDKKRLLAKCSQLQIENGLLKSSLMLQNQVNAYMKECVDNLRDEFLELFLYNYNTKGEEFIQAIKELESAKKNGLPKSLLTPLKKSQATETEPEPETKLQVLRDSLTNLEIGGKPNIDSAVGTIDDEFKELNAMLLDTKKENEWLKNENVLLKNENRRLESQNHGQELIDSMIRANEKLENELKNANKAVSF